jgi:hypothetical protein
VVWQRAALAEQVAGFGRHHSSQLNKTEEKTEKKKSLASNSLHLKRAEHFCLPTLGMRLPPYS